MRSLLGRFHRPMSRGLVNNMLTMNNLGDGSTLSLDFTTMGGVLDPRLTFSRASTATFVNSSGYVEYAGANIQPYSQDQSQTGTWVRQDLSGVDANVVATTDPNGGSNASKIKSAASLQAHLVYSTISTSISSGLAYTFSVYVKKAELKYFAIHLASTARYTVIFDLDTGVMTATNSTGTPLGTSYSSSNAGDGWWRLSATMITQSTTIYPHLCLSNSGTPSVNASGQPYYSGTLNDGVYTWGAQLNPGSTAQTYYPTTTAAYHAPRFDYSPTNIGEPRGLLIEGQTANVCPQSQALTTGWQNVAMNTPTVPSSPTITDPFGGTSATWKLVASFSGTSVPHTWRTATLTFTAASYTFSFWAKAAEYDRIMLCDPGSGLGGCLFVLTGNGTATVVANVVTPTNPQITPYPNGWYRCSVTMVTTAANYAFGISGYPSSGATTGAFGPNYISDGISGVYATAMQIELGSGASSYIPTGASQVTRNGDQVVLSNLPSMAFSQSAGTVYSQVEIMEKLRGSFIPYGSFDTSGGGRGWWWLRHNHDTSVGQRILGTAFNSVGSTGIGSSNYTHSSGVFKFATSLDTSVARMVYVINGGSAQTTTATGFTLATAAQMSINKNNDVVVTESGSMWFRTLKYWPTALPDAQLTSITS